MQYHFHSIFGKVSMSLVSLMLIAGGPSEAQARKRKKRSLYSSLKRVKRGLNHRVLRLAVKAYTCAKRKRQVRKPYLVVIDYTKPSNQRRLWVFDVKKRRLLHREWVSHGRYTGSKWARHFSNRPNSRKSSLGVFVTAQTYYGKHGYSLRLDGLERGFNHLARRRAIVMHGASYVSRAFIRRHGRLGRSWGCPALRRKVSRRILRRIKGGSLLFSYYPNKRWLRTSRYLRCRP